MHFLRRRLLMGLLVALALAVVACDSGGSPAPTQTPWIIVVTNTPGPAAPATAAPTAPAQAATAAATTIPTAAPARSTTVPQPARLATYQGTGAPFSIQYPSNWSAEDQEKDQRLVTFIAPDNAAYLLVIYGPGGSLSPEEATTTFLQSFTLPNLKFGSLKKNADGSVGLDIEFNDQSSNAPWQGQMRVVKQSSSQNFYVIMFAALRDAYEPLKLTGGNLLASFQERASVVIARTPPPVIGLPTATPTTRALPPAATNTPVPTDTPEPPPTNTPRPVFQFRTEVRPHEGYERWGAPKDGCRSWETGQWDNNHPIKRLTMDLTIYNNYSRAMTPADIDLAMTDNAGRDLLWCVFGPDNGPLPSIPSRGKAMYVVTTFVELNNYLSELRTTVFGATARDCFAAKNSADVIACR